MVGYLGLEYRYQNHLNKETNYDLEVPGLAVEMAGGGTYLVIGATEKGSRLNWQR